MGFFEFANGLILLQKLMFEASNILLAEVDFFKDSGEAKVLRKLVRPGLGAGRLNLTLNRLLIEA